MTADPLDLVRFTDQATATATADELDHADRHTVDLTDSVTLHAGHRHGIPTFIVEVAGAGSLSTVISAEPLDD